MGWWSKDRGPQEYKRVPEHIWAEYETREAEWGAWPDYEELMRRDDGSMDIASDEGGWGAWMGGEL